MDREEDSRELERKIAQASRIASSVSDQTTVGRLLAWAEDLRASYSSTARLVGRKKKSGRAPGNSGSKTVGRKGVTWSSGFRQKPRSMMGVNRCARLWKFA